MKNVRRDSNDPIIVGLKSRKDCRILKKVEGYGATAQRQPEANSTCWKVAKISNRRNTNIKPGPFKMSFVHVTAARGAETLHVVVASANEDSSESVEYYMSPNVKVASGSAISLIQSANTVRRTFDCSGKHGEDDVDDQAYSDCNTCNEGSEAPSCITCRVL